MSNYDLHACRRCGREWKWAKGSKPLPYCIKGMVVM